MGQVVAIAGAMIGLVVVSGLTQVASLAIQNDVAGRIGVDLRTRLYRRVFEAPRESFDGKLVATLHDRVVTDSLRCVEFFGAALNKLVPDIIVTLGVAVILLVLDWRLALVTLCFVPVLLVLTRAMIRRQHPAVRRYHGLFADFSTRVMRIVRSQDLIRVVGSEHQELARAEAELDDVRDAQWRFEVTAATNRAAQQTVIGIAGAVLVVAGALAVINSDTTLGEILAFYAAFAMLRGPAGTVAGAYSELLAGWHAFERVEEFLHEGGQGPYHGTRCIELGGHFALRNVSFGYDAAHPVLREVSLEISPGEVTALVGPNGSGKSTVVNLLLGFYRPTAGQVLADGIAYEDLDLHHLRRQLGVVSQEPFLLPGTVRENIGYGAELDEASLERALRISGADGVVAALPRGLDTVVGEDGHLLSGGQRQRLAIARALLRSPHVLILDEPTNHLDEQAIAGLLERLGELRGHISVLLVSHQAQVKVFADRVVELE